MKFSSAESFLISNFQRMNHHVVSETAAENFLDTGGITWEKSILYLLTLPTKGFKFNIIAIFHNIKIIA